VGVPTGFVALRSWNDDVQSGITSLASLQTCKARFTIKLSCAGKEVDAVGGGQVTQTNPHASWRWALVGLWEELSCSKNGRETCKDRLS
jgi:hypothetical protein